MNNKSYVRLKEQTQENGDPEFGFVCFCHALRPFRLPLEESWLGVGCGTFGKKQLGWNHPGSVQESRNYKQGQARLFWMLLLRPEMNGLWSIEMISNSFWSFLFLFLSGLPSYLNNGFFCCGYNYKANVGNEPKRIALANRFFLNEPSLCNDSLSLFAVLFFFPPSSFSFSF